MSETIESQQSALPAIALPGSFISLGMTVARLRNGRAMRIRTRRSDRVIVAGERGDGVRACEGGVPDLQQVSANGI